MPFNDIKAFEDAGPIREIPDQEIKGGLLNSYETTDGPAKRVIRHSSANKGI